MKRYIFGFLLALLIFTTGCAEVRPSEPRKIGEYEVLSVYQYCKIIQGDAFML